MGKTGKPIAQLLAENPDPTQPLRRLECPAVAGAGPEVCGSPEPLQRYLHPPILHALRVAGSTQPRRLIELYGSAVYKT